MSIFAPVQTVWTSYSPTFTGFSANPVVTARYVQFGNTVIYEVRTTTNGTSNLGSFTMSIPVASNATTNLWTAPLNFTNNGTVGTTPGLAFIANSSSTVTLDTNYAGAGGWTSSGSKGASFTIIYETA